MSHEDVLNAVMSVVHGDFTHRTALTRYNFLNRKILQIATTLKSTQEQQDTPLAESYNQQQIFRLVIDNLNLPSFQGQGYTEWELCEACEKIILIKSSYSKRHEEFGVPKYTIWCTLNVIFPPLKFSSLKHLWDIIVVDKTTDKIVR